MNDSFKDLFKGIMMFLITVIVLLVLSIVFNSCHSQKENTKTSTENVEVVKAASITTETAARSQWMSSLNIDLDSFELLMPFIDTAIEVPEMAPYTSPYTAGKAHYAVLRGKRASIGRSDLAERNASRCASQIDSAASHRTMDRAEHHARDTVAITKPPNVTWWSLAILAAVAVVVAVRYYIKKKW